MKLIERIKKRNLEKNRTLIHLDFCSIKHGDSSDPQKMIKNKFTRDTITCDKFAKKFSSFYGQIYSILKKYFDAEITDTNPCRYIKATLNMVPTDSILSEYLFFAMVAKDTYRFEEDKSLYTIDNIASIIVVKLYYFIRKNKHSDVKLIIKLEPTWLDRIPNEYSVSETSNLYRCDQ